MKNRYAFWALAMSMTAVTLPLSAQNQSTPPQNQPTSGQNQSPSGQTQPLSTQDQSTSGQNSSSVGQMARADRVYGNQVISSDNQKLGRLNNLMVDLESGRVLYAVIGETSGRVAVAPQIFTSTQPANKELRVKEPKAKIDSAPRFNAQVDTPAEWANIALAAKVYQHFGEQMWWQGAGPADQGTFHNVHKASEVIGMKVKDASDQPLGKVENIVVNLPAGRIGYVILAPDARLNLGNNLYALPPQALTLSTDRQMLVSGLDLKTLSSGPHFAANQWPNLSDASFASKVYQHYGKQAWFQSGGSSR